ncbi:hypothetical protein TIFTF001_041261 [Ficus carica]|uniref:Uncharacterized protein n=1 Tax=Ficus carica TaxID=3494 RepID=A0AA87Z360_FICCA|nr:hypothetical protein TIFTF001_041261 [Ficus carica]
MILASQKQQPRGCLGSLAAADEISWGRFTILRSRGWIGIPQWGRRGSSPFPTESHLAGSTQDSDFVRSSRWFVVGGVASPTEVPRAGEGFGEFADRGVATAFILESRRPAKARSGYDPTTRISASYARESDHNVCRHR